MSGSALLVEDDPALRRALQVGLTDLTFEVLTSGPAAEALSRLEQRDFDVVLTLPQRVRNYQPSHIIVAGENPDELVPMEEVERRYILRVLDVSAGNQRLPARVLGFDRKTLYRKLERYGVS